MVTTHPVGKPPQPPPPPLLSSACVWYTKKSTLAGVWPRRFYDVLYLWRVQRSVENYQRPPQQFADGREWLIATHYEVQDPSKSSPPFVLLWLSCFRRHCHQLVCCVALQLQDQSSAKNNPAYSTVPHKKQERYHVDESPHIHRSYHLQLTKLTKNPFPSIKSNPN